MRLAVRSYEKGDDMQAMDRFMEILTTGEPTERNMANEYLNLITRRMHTSTSLPGISETVIKSYEPVGGPQSQPVGVTGVTIERPKKSWLKRETKSEPRKPEAQPAVLEPEKAAATPAPAAGESAAKKPVVSVSAGELPGFTSAPEKTAARSEAAPPEDAPQPGDPAEMRKEIKARIRGVMEAGLDELKAVSDIRILLNKKGDPEALGIPSALLFESADAFQKTAPDILNALVKLVYGCGHLQVVILPEGSATGETKIQDMRRTTGISSYLYQMGVAPPRVKVDLVNTQSQVEIPQALRSFKGIVIIFIDRPLKLELDSSIGDIGDEGGPSVSLGLYPASLRPNGMEGVIIEFSVQDSQAKPVSWKFQLLQPVAFEGRDLSPLQEVSAEGPAFHQIYWNGRKGYYGRALAAGRYECVLTARDGNDKQRTLRRWIQVLDYAGSAPVVKQPQPPRIKKPAVFPAVAKQRSAVSAKAAAKSYVKSADSYQFDFERNSYQLPSGSEKTLAAIAQAADERPNESLKITGYAQTAESDAAQLAERRAQMAAGLLINKYRIEPKKIQLSSQVEEAPGAYLQIQFVASEGHGTQ